MQLLLVDGRLGRDAEVRVSQSGDKYLKFSLANRVKKNNEEDTVWYDVITSKPEFLNKLPEFLKKGSYVIVSGKLEVTTRVVDAKVFTNLTIRPSSIEFGGGGKRNDEDGATTASQVTDTPQPTVPVTEVPENLFAGAEMPVDAVVQPSSTSLVDEPEDDLPF